MTEPAGAFALYDYDVNINLLLSLSRSFLQVMLEAYGAQNGARGNRFAQK